MSYLDRNSVDKSVSKLYYALYCAQMNADWKKADEIQKKLRELEEKEKRNSRIDVA